MGRIPNTTNIMATSKSFHGVLLGSVSLLACGIVLASTPSAFAQTDTPASTSTTVNSNGLNILVNPNIDLTGNPGISIAVPTGTVTNQGTIVTSVGTAVLDSSILTLLSNSGTIASAGFDGIRNNEGSIGTISNFGTIAGNSVALNNSNGSIGTLTNNGLISGHDAILNQSGTIELLNNAAGGTIAGVNFGNGIYNFQGGNIVTLSNAGLISGYSGIRNPDGTIGQLVNTGTITADALGVYNAGLIDTITNSGTIAGGAAVSYNAAIYNTGSIGTLANNGLIGGGAVYGVENLSGGAIGVIANAGAGTINGAYTGVNNTGSLGTLSNSGLIIGTLYVGLSNNEGLGTVINSGTGTVAGGFYGLQNEGTIAALINAGTIAGTKYAGINNDVGGTILTLGNSVGGTISGSETGVLNTVLIGTLTNAGMISGSIYGIYNNEGTIGTIANFATGSISGTSRGIENTGFIGTLSNAGSIGGATNEGILNFQGTILQLTNQAGGTITGADLGINNDSGFIGTLINSGLIGGTVLFDGIFNQDGTIGTLANSSTGTITGATAGISNTGIFGTLTNAGTITGATDGIYNNTGTILSLDNAGGTITGATGIRNTGSIGTIANQTGGIITAGTTGILNSNLISTLTNTGLINGGFVGVRNESSIISTINFLSNETGGTISGGLEGIDNDNVIATLTNAGTITGGSGGFLIAAGIYNGDGATIGQLTNTTIGVIFSNSYGIYNNGAIATLTNAGQISGTNPGIKNAGTITTSDNTANGTISGANTGIANIATGSIGTLTNAGFIFAGNDKRGGIYNLGQIAVIENTGTIGEGYTSTGNFDLAYAGIDNGGDIGQLTNNNLIIGRGVGIINEGTITSLGNTGTISGSYSGIYNQSGLIQTLSNSGLITGFDSGIENNGGTITTLTNNATGTISGQTAIYSSGGGLGTLTNSGLIAGSVKIFDQDVNIIGGTGSIFGTLTGGNIILAAGSNLDLLSGNEILTDNVAATTEDSGAGAIGTLTNSGILQIGYPGEPATISVAGDYAQTPDGTLNVIVTPAASSEMTITGTASLSGGVDYIFAPGTYAPKTYAYLTAGSITGTFTSENYGTAPVSDVSTTYEGDPTADLVIGSGFSLPMVVNPSDSSIFSDQTQALAGATQQSDASLLGMAATGGAAASPACEGQAALNPGATNGNNANIASAIAAELCNHGGWIQADGSLGHVDGNEGAAAYNANTAGFLAGIDSLFGPAGTRLGFAIGYDETYLSDKSGGSGDMGTTRVALYGAQPLGPVLLSAVIGYGHAGNDTTRSTAVGGIKEKNDLGIVSGALQASTALPLQNLTLIPAAGIRFVNVEAASFTEAPGANNAFALTGRTKNFNSVQPYATVELTTSYLTPSGMSFAPQATLGLQEEAGNLGAATNLYAADGTYFASTHTSTAPLAAIIGAGLTATKSNLSFYINYNGLIAANWNTQSGTAGLRINF